MDRCVAICIWVAEHLGVVCKLEVLGGAALNGDNFNYSRTKMINDALDPRLQYGSVSVTSLDTLVIATFLIRVQELLKFVSSIILVRKMSKFYLEIF